jgi:YegS/Rv2252/BmrU family lipid kinase
MTLSTSPDRPRLLLIMNPSSGQNSPDLRLLNRMAHEAGWDWEMQVTNQFGDGTRLAREAVERGIKMVIAYGGDGTVMDATGGLLNCDVPLGIIPGGTGNAFAKELLVPLNFEEACQVIFSNPPVVRRVDIGAVGERLFLLRLGVGLESDITVMADRSQKDRLGQMAYATATIKAWNQAKTSRYTLNLDGETVKIRGLACTVANAATLGIPGVSISHEIRVDDGMLDVFVIRRADLKELASLAASIVGKENLVSSSLPHWKCKEVTITSTPAQGVEADGEEWGETPVSIRVLPGALKVIAPK